MKNLKKIAALFLIVLLSSCGDSEMVSLVKNGTLENYPEKTLGTAIENYFGTPYWTSGESEEGEKFVNVEGNCLASSAIVALTSLATCVALASDS